MAPELTYQDYVNNEAHMDYYRTYQQRYATRIRESDRVLLDLVREKSERISSPAVLDMGCSTGNFLLHLKRLAPNLELVGADVVTSIITENRRNPDLSGIEFRALDMLNLTPSPEFDVVVTNAALMFFSTEEFERAIANIAKVVKPGGSFVAFDLFHPFEEEIAIVETTKLHPGGLKLFLRGQAVARSALERAGFANAEFRMFHMPFDLPRPADPADITTHTVRTGDGERLSFRGALYQPWCHVAATRT